MRSGYHVAREISRQESNKGESSRAGLDGLVWRHWWKMKVPNKIKVIGWRACQNAMPTRENLACCKVVEDGWCEACKLESESVAHVLWQCGGSARHMGKEY